ncbi:nucleotide-binding universal stress UspA family protein [Actinoalloteichus hoggarensis]|uniref:Universal stress protein n=1 Tax=Actinoalloteichus hoggarensis TaxID=1470176 RepID=A0A221W1F7_9PSEU|nr:universal stress protein [Actinoalloteichus hoggarensis]ASO19614.1 Universal stress protein [Actinoalloteichus hoggarensis]MBB5919679.1 nucleotide-binding universal stress UspA family protein [Actinoalloteichus hoggarensis]
MSEETPDRVEGRRPIVVGVDGSAASVAALAWVLAQGEARRRQIHAVSAWHFVPMAAGPATVLVDPGDARQDHVERLREAVAEAVEKVTGPSGPGSVAPGEPTGLDDVDIRQEVIEGPPATVLLDAAQDAAVLVLGSHGHGRAYASLVGSVSAACIRHARCPVIVIPPGMTEEETTESLLAEGVGG